MNRKGEYNVSEAILKQQSVSEDSGQDNTAVELRTAANQDCLKDNPLTDDKGHTPSTSRQGSTDSDERGKATEVLSEKTKEVDNKVRMTSTDERVLNITDEGKKVILPGLRPIIDEGLIASLRDTISTLDGTLKAHVKVLKGILKESKTTKVTTGAGKEDQDKCVQLQPEEKMVIYIRIVFLKIGEIDTVKENFAADVFIQAKWREPLLDGLDELSREGYDPGQYWNPKLNVENALGDPSESLWYTLIFDEEGKAYVLEKRRIKANFLEFMELNQFPFDTQDLTVSVTSERSAEEIQLEEDISQVCSINVQSFVDEQEWALHDHIDVTKKVTMPQYKNTKFRQAMLSASCKAARRPGFFIWNILLVMLFICSLAFATFTVDVEKPQNRLQLSFTLVLTTIAFKFVANQSLPKISYLTYLDKYILTSMTILCTICVWHSIIPKFMSHESVYLADKIALIVIGAIYILFHIIFFSWIYFQSWKKRRQYRQKDIEHKEKMERLGDVNNQTNKVGPV